MGGFDTIFGNSPNNGNFTAGGNAAPIINAANLQQANTAYDTAQGALSQQQALAQALQAQGTQGMGYQTQLGQALSAQSQGQGPNPAQAQFAQNTEANTANQAALMAGQRGAASNVGLIARQAGRLGAATEQNSAGQAASLQAQQQLNAQQQLQNLAQTQIGQTAGESNAYSQAAQGEQSNILNAIAAQNNANVALQSNMNNANAAMSQTNSNASTAFIGGLINPLGGTVSNAAVGGGGSSGAVGGGGSESGAIGGGGAASGGGEAAAAFAKGGIVKENPKLSQVPQQDRFDMPDHIKGMAAIYHPELVKMAYGGVINPGYIQINEGSSNAIANASPVRQSKPIVSSSNPKPDDSPNGPSDTESNVGTSGGGGMSETPAAFTNSYSKGAIVPGKPKVNHNTEKNDVVPALLTPKEIVLPISVTQAKDAPEAAKQFVMALLAKQGDKSGSHEDDLKKALKMAYGGVIHPRDANISEGSPNPIPNQARSITIEIMPDGFKKAVKLGREKDNKKDEKKDQDEDKDPLSPEALIGDLVDILESALFSRKK